MENSHIGYGLDEDLRKLEKDEPHFCLQILESAIELTGFEDDSTEEKNLFEPGSYDPSKVKSEEELEAEVDFDVSHSEEEVEPVRHEKKPLPPEDVPEYVELAYHLGLLGFLYTRGHAGKREEGVVLIEEESSWQLKREFLNGNRIEKVIESVEKKDKFLKPLFESLVKVKSEGLSEKINAQVYYTMVCLGAKYFLIGDERARQNEFKPWMKNMNTYHRDKKDDRGDRKSYSDRGDRGDRKSYSDRGDRGDRKSYSDRGDRGDRKSYSDRGDRGDRKSYSDRGERGDRKSYSDRGDSRSFKNKGFRKSDSAKNKDWGKPSDSRDQKGFSSKSKKDPYKKSDNKMKGRPDSKKPNDGPSKKGGFRR